MIISILEFVLMGLNIRHKIKLYSVQCYTECHYAECCNTKCHYAECHYSECHDAECRDAKHFSSIKVNTSVLIQKDAKC